MISFVTFVSFIISITFLSCVRPTASTRVFRQGDFDFLLMSFSICTFSEVAEMVEHVVFFLRVVFAVIGEACLLRYVFEMHVFQLSSKRPRASLRQYDKCSTKKTP